MIIHQPTIEKANGKISVSARVEMQNPVPGLPDQLWFKFPEEYESYISKDSDAFATAMLILAMHFGENLEMRGTVSKKLAFGLQEYMHIFHLHYRKQFKRIDLRFESIVEKEPKKHPGKVATAFSGGIDSFFNVWSFLPENQTVPVDPLDYGLFIHGLDSRLDDEVGFDQAANKFNTALKQLRIKLLTAQTNYILFSQFRISTELWHGAPLIAAALLLGDQIKKFYVPSGRTYESGILLSTSPLSDHLFSTELIEIIHFGAAYNRLEKIEAIKDWPIIYDHIRVCSDKDKLDGLNNCSRCHKCLKTMIALESVGVFDRMKTFKQPFSHWYILRWGALNQTSSSYMIQIINKAFRKAVSIGRWDIAAFIPFALIISQITKFFRKSFIYLLPNKWLFWLKQKVYKPDQAPTH